MAGRIPEADKQDIVDRYQAGDLIADIEEQSGYTRPTIYYVLRQYGIRPSRTARHATDMADASDLLVEVATLQRQIGRLQTAVRVLGGVDLEPAKVGLSTADLPPLD